MATIQANWTKVAATEQLQRSSHAVTTVGDAVYVFGGELKPREPRDNDLHRLDLRDRTSVQSTKASSTAPSPRVGAATTKIGDKIYLFSGRGGPAMASIDEAGGLWSLDTTNNTWSLIQSSYSSQSFPEPRSFHCMTSNGKDTIYLHAGCPASGRLSDLWSFDITSKEWRQLASAPEPPRGGTSIAFAGGKLYRMNGFDGTREIGGQIDVYDLETDNWSSIAFEADGKTGPGARSVAALLPVRIEGGIWLVTLFGESDPSSLGHQGAGKMLSDIWAYSIEKGVWSAVSATSEDDVLPDARGWFDADVVRLDGKDGIVVSGGLGESNERLDDLWVLNF